jgi:lysophospholipase L1-like esterase
MKKLAALLLLALTLAAPAVSRAEYEGKLQILLLGDSTTEASIPKKYAPKEPQLEDVIRILLAAEGDLPPANVINLGQSGEFIRRLIDTGRYDKLAAKLPGIDYVVIRYGLNDHAKREDFETNFPKDFHELLAKLRSDHPQAKLIVSTVIPFADEATSAQINGLIRQVADEEKLTFFDIYPRYAAELKQGPNMLSYHRFPLSKIPEKLRELVKPYVTDDKDPAVVVLDNRLDAHLGNLKGWFGDRHPNLAGYHVIADETAKFLAPLIRAKSHEVKQ